MVQVPTVVERGRGVRAQRPPTTEATKGQDVMVIRGLIGAGLGACLAWVVMVAFGVAGPDHTLLRDLFEQAWGAVVGAAKWVVGAHAYPQRAALILSAVAGFMLAAKAGK